MARVFALVGYQPDNKQRAYISDETLLDDLRQILAEHGRIDTALILATPGAANPHTYAAHFGTLRQAYERVGYKPQPAQRGSLSRHELLSRLRTLYERHGKISGELMHDDPDVPHPTTYQRRFGSFEEACALVGFKARRRPNNRPRSKAKRHSKE